MKKLLIGLFLLALIMGGTSASWANVITFDDGFLATSSYAPIMTPPSGSDGLIGNGQWSVMSYDYYKSASTYKNPNFIPLSNPNFAFNDNGTVLGLSRATPFIFDGVYLAGWAANNQVPYGDWTASYVTIDGYLNNNLVGSYQANLTDLQLAYFTPGFGSIDTLLFRPEGLPYSPTNEATSDKYFLLDNLTFHNATSAVPEPATMSLLGLGFLGLLGLGKRKK